MARRDPVRSPEAEVWKRQDLARSFVQDTRAGIPFASAQIEVMLQLVAAVGRPVGRVADLGCGDGVLGRALLADHPAARGLFVDFSEPMLVAAREQLRTSGDRARLVSADLGTPAWLDGARPWVPFDAIVSGYAIHHLPDGRKRALFGEIFGLLEPGGIFVNVEHVSSQSPWGEARSDERFVAALYRLERERGGGRTLDEVAEAFRRRPDRAANILAPVETQCEWLRGIGFEDVDCYFKAFELAVFAGRRPSSSRRRERRRSP
jgi:SAM-dependent methyltransferase